MKTKNRVVALFGIAIVLCSMFLVALPATAFAAEQDDYVLGIYGNANEDDTIDMRDLTYVKLIFFGKKPETELADAKYDGKINPLDFIQIKLIIVGKEKELTLVDQADRIVTVKKPIKRIIVASTYVAEVMRSLKAPTDKIVAVNAYFKWSALFFGELAELPDIGDAYSGVDYERIAEIQPDLVFLYAYPKWDEMAKKIEFFVPGVTVVRTNIMQWSGREWKPEDATDCIKKLGYIFDREKEVEELFDFRERHLNEIKEKVKTLSEDEKPRVFLTHPEYLPEICYTTNRLSTTHRMIVDAGGINIAADIMPEPGSTSIIIDLEWPIEQDPEIILGTTKLGYKKGAVPEAELNALRDKIVLQPAWGYMSAVKSGEVYLIESRVAGGWITQYFIGTAYMAKLFHPDLFEDLDPYAIHREYLEIFQGFDPNVIENWVFVYPPFE